MDRARLEREFTSMLVNTNTHRAYHNLVGNYITTTSDCQLLSWGECAAKLEALRESDPKEWISKIFTEGLQITSELDQVNAIWLKHLEEIEWS